LPLIRNAADRGTVMIMDEKNVSGLVYRPLCDSLEIHLGYDKPDNVLSVSINQLSNWHLSEQESFDIALENLRARSAKPMKKLVAGTYESDWDDYHDPARLLLPDVLQRHAVRGAPVVMVPGKGKLLLTGDQDAAGMALMVRRAERELTQPRALSPLMLRLLEGRWTKFEPSAHAAKLHGLRLGADAQAYTYQKQFLDERAARRSEDIFVANYMLGQGSDGVPSRSACAWSKGVVALLPKTELLTFVEPNGDPADAVVIEWSQAIPIIGHLMRETGDIPARFYVADYPDKEQLARLREAALTKTARRKDHGAASGDPSNAASAATPLIDPNSQAGNPGGLTLSLAKLRALQPQLFSDARPQDAGNRSQWLQLLVEQLQGGDSRAAVVIDADEGVVAAYTDELDCIVLLKFDARIARANAWAPGTRLLAVNVYSPKAPGIARDLEPGPKQTGNWGNFRPLIADLLTDDDTRLAAAKKEIPEEEWARAQQMGQKAYAVKKVKPRDGRPLTCGTPAAPERPPSVAKPAQARPAREPRPTAPVARFHWRPLPMIVTALIVVSALLWMRHPKAQVNLANVPDLAEMKQLLGDQLAQNDMICVNTWPFPFDARSPPKWRPGFPVGRACENCDALAEAGLLTKSSPGDDGSTAAGAHFELSDLGRSIYRSEIRNLDDMSDALRARIERAKANPAIGPEASTPGFCFADKVKLHQILDALPPLQMGGNRFTSVQYDIEAVNPSPLLFDPRFRFLHLPQPQRGTPGLYPPAIATFRKSLSFANSPGEFDNFRYGAWVNK
jgi:hypothetical protein